MILSLISYILNLSSCFQTKLDSCLEFASAASISLHGKFCARRQSKRVPEFYAVAMAVARSPQQTKSWAAGLEEKPAQASWTYWYSSFFHRDNNKMKSLVLFLCYFSPLRLIWDNEPSIGVTETQRKRLSNRHSSRSGSEAAVTGWACERSLEPWMETLLPMFLWSSS